MRLIRKFMFIDSTPAEIHLVQIETDAERKAKIDAAIAAARESMGKRLLVHPANQVKRLKEAA